ncbi:MAG: response regulator [Oligoflexales bacterium]|nr:response regulator [Oligoflexales bacterium]
MIQKQNFNPEKLKHGIETIEESAKIQGQLIDDLLDISRIQSGKLSVQFTEVDPREPIRQAIEAVQLTAQNRHVAIETEIKLKTEKIWGDPERLQQIVWNLLNNAIKFSHPGSTVRVLVEVIEELGMQWVSIKVSDQGKGIEPEFLGRIFDRFSQADSSSIRVHGGLGIGLAIVSDLVHLQGGTVKAESEGLGRGAKFTAFLPVKSATEIVEKSRESAAKKVQKEAGSPNLAGLCVMIVEDELKALEVLSEVLTTFGAKTIPCSSAAEALTAFNKSKPNILVSDIAMPGEDGLSLIQKIRELGADRGGDIPSLALSANATEAGVKHALLVGFNSHMAKPFDALRLAHEVAKLAGRGH